MLANDPTGLLTEAFQVCFVCAKRASGVQRLSDQLGLTGWVEFEAELEVDGATGTGAATVAVAFARWGTMIVEVLEPMAGPVEVFRRALPTEHDNMRLHHVGIRVADLTAARVHAEKTGAACVLSGGIADQIRFAFVDTTAQLGHHLELVEFSPEGWALMSGILNGEGESA